MNIKPSHAAVVLVGLIATHASAADTIQLVWTPEGRFVQETTVAATKFVEVCGKLAAKTSVRWKFDATAPLDFNIHYHEGKKVLYPAKQEQVTQGSDVLAVKVDQTYCWMWTNKTTASATLKLEVQKD